MIRNQFVVHALACVVAFIIACETSPAQDLTAKGREIFKKHQTSVITVELVIKSKFGFGGGSDARESRQEVTGTVIDPSGLTAVSLSSTDPTGMLSSFMGGFGGDDEESFKLKMESEVSDVKLLTHDGSELPAEIVLRDKDLDLAFVRPKTKPAAPLPALDLSSNAKVDVLDQVITVNRLGKVAGRAYAASIERINAVVQRPRLFYVPGSDATATGLGCPAFTTDGKVVGLFVMRSLKSGGGAMGLFNMQSPPIMAILLPADDVKKVAAQVPAAKEEAKAAEAQTQFDVVLASLPADKKIAVIKAVREVRADLGLAEAKALVEGAPKPVLEGVSKADADSAKKKLEEAGAKVEVK